ncbi:NYN domain-containing protein [uncultured Mycolicibacterium sp.]|uniref:NYN domain-containing protein n=1 Tax=uncultured Mycolicibacterium sp. TaxID=2320817 RepID=UPI00261D1FDC|nr:NYN domain-containing protein [uncultured Mycolicibacterium sp.]
MPWIVDAMNVIGTRPDGWWRDRDGAMRRLVAALEAWAAAGNRDVVVVFERPVAVGSVSVRVHWAPAGGRDAADDEIVRIVAGLNPADCTVVTSDAGLARRVRAAGAAVYPAAAFRDLLDRADG